MKIGKIRYIYYKIKAESELPVAMLTYIIFDGKTYSFKTLCVNFREDDVSLKNMYKAAGEENFYAFANSEKGEEFIEENKEALAQAFTGMVLQNAGYGTRVCKN